MRFSQILEAVVGTHHVDAALKNMISYLGKSLNVSFIRIPGVEHFKNSSGTGWGMRYVYKGSTKSIRFNWASEPGTGKSNQLVSIDYFDGSSGSPTYNFATEGISFVKILPVFAHQLEAPIPGQHPVFATSTHLHESALLEAKRGDFTPASALEDFMARIGRGQSLTRSDFIGSYHISNVEIFDKMIRDFGDKLDIQGKRISALPDVDLSVLKDAVLSSCDGYLNVTHGTGQETALETDQETVEDTEEHVSFSDSLEHLKGLTTSLIKGSFNALFVAGAGGVGKTQSVEDALSEAGLSDGDGYFKNTGSASPIGIYGLLYKYRTGIILFDDSDGALADQDGRNLLKAATDTKKIRKLAWNKKSSTMYDPADYPTDYQSTDPEELPKYFNFEGRIIFISNLPIDKLDPDKALRTRAFMISINPTPEELFEHMGKILHKINLEDGLTLTSAERYDVLEVVKAKKKNVSLRTLVRALNLAASGAQNWRELVRLYA